MSGFRQLALASTRMLFRSPSTLRVAFVTPVVFAALIALYERLSFETESASVDFFDYIAVGMAAWYITYTAQHGMTGAAAGYRAEGVLKRLAVTPISSLGFISAQVLARIALAIAQVIAVLGAARLLGASIQLGANLAWVLVPVTMVVLMGLSIGFIWAGVTRTPEGANTLDVIMAIPLLFLAGALWPRAAYPDAVESVVEYAIPFVAPFDMLRGIALDGASIAGYGSELVVGAAWLVGLVTLATRTYRLMEG
ncbi:MAG: ABC transporter permease [Solirubrobacterales bacterium]